MERDQALTEKVRKFCDKIGIDVVGFADPILFDKFPQGNRPNTYLADANTVIIIGLHLYDLVLDAWNYSRIENRNYQFADSIIENLCHKVKRYLEKKGYNSVVISYQPGLFLKDSAALAGIGPIGKNNLLITPKFGSQVRLRALVTTAPLVCGEPIRENNLCKSCEICLNSCPANAFTDGKYTKKICDEWARANWEKLSDYTVIWCNKCIESCPYTKNKKIIP